MTAPHIILISKKLYCHEEHTVMMHYKYSSYGKGNATDTETTKRAKETDSLHLILSGAQVINNIAKGLENYFTLLHSNTCKKLEVEPNILPPFQSHVVVFLVFLPSKTHITIKKLHLAGWLEFLSPVWQAKKNKGLNWWIYISNKTKAKTHQKKESQPLSPLQKTQTKKKPTKQEHLTKTCTKPTTSKCWTFLRLQLPREMHTMWPPLHLLFYLEEEIL